MRAAVSPRRGLAVRLWERLRGGRNALLSSGAFQDWAASFPLTRPMARKSAQDLFTLCTGFVHSQVLFACVELNVFDHLRATALTPARLAGRIGLPLEGCERLVKAAAALDLLSAQSGDRYGLGDLGAALMGNPSVFAMIRHHSALYRDLSDPVALLRSRGGETELARFWAYAGADDPAQAVGADAAPYSDLMAETQAFVAREVLRAVSLKGARRVLDVGGGSGAFLAEAARHTVDADLVLCDLPAVAALAEQRFSDAGLSHRARAVGCDMFRDPLPGGADVATLVRVLHDHDDGPAAAVLASVRRALAPGGRLIIAEPMAGTRGARAMGDAYFGLYLWAMGSGRPRRAAELLHMARDAGFTRVREIRTRQPLLVRVLEAR